MAPTHHCDESQMESGPTAHHRRLKATYSFPAFPTTWAQVHNISCPDTSTWDLGLLVGTSDAEKQDSRKSSRQPLQGQHGSNTHVSVHPQHFKLWHLMLSGGSVLLSRLCSLHVFDHSSGWYHFWAGFSQWVAFRQLCFCLNWLELLGLEANKNSDWCTFHRLSKPSGRQKPQAVPWNILILA